jgi:predicted nucleic acid-binding protein
LIVLDASAAVCLLSDDPPDRARRINARLADQPLHAPHLIDLEIAQALRRRVTIGDIALQRAQQVLRDLGDLALTRYPHGLLLGAVWRMRENRTPYDAAYVALGELLGAPVLTLDARMARTPAQVPIEVF